MTPGVYCHEMAERCRLAAEVCEPADAEFLLGRAARYQRLGDAISALEGLAR